MPLNGPLAEEGTIPFQELRPIVEEYCLVLFKIRPYKFFTVNSKLNLRQMFQESGAMRWTYIDFSSKL